MAEDDERREGSKRSGRRDPARNARRDPPVIEGQAEDVTPPVDPISASGDMMEAPNVEAEHPDAVRPEMTSHAAVPEQATDENLSSSANMQDAATPTQADATPQADTRASPAQASRTPWGTLAALGFIVLAAGLLYLFYQISSLPPDNSAAVADLKSRLAAIEARPATDAAGLSDRVAKLEHATGEVRTGIDALGKRVDGLAATLAGQAKVAADVTGLQTAVSELKTDLAGVKSSVAALPRPDIGRLESRMGDVDQKLANLQGVVSGIPHVDLGPLTGKVDALEARLKPIETETAEARAPDRVAQRRAAPVAVTAQGIVEAIASNQPFPKQLQALRTLGADPAKLAPLQAVAENGAPSLHDLQASLAELRDRIVSQGATPASGSYVDRLVAGASSLVQVRPLGSVVGDSPSAVVARMNDAIGHDDLAAALADWHKLPEASQTASKALAERLKLRLDAEQAAKDIATNAIGAMAVPRG